MTEIQGAMNWNEIDEFYCSIHEELDVEVFERNTTGRAFYDKYGFKLIKEHMHKETNYRLLRMKFNTI